MTPEQAAQALEGIADELGRDFTEGDLLEVGHLATTMVLARTKQGLDPDLKPFVPYAPGYAKERLAAGLTTTPVDLVRTGATLSAVIPRVLEPGSVTVGPFLSERAAQILSDHAGGVHQTVELRPRERGIGIKRTQSRPFQRRQNLPKREVLDVRSPAELEVLAEAAGRAVIVRIVARLEGRQP
jgi:hypothetical protein